MQLANVPETFRGYVLDGFQREAIFHLLQGASVFVAAPTGSGKTLIADYVVEMTRPSQKGVIYTAPIKALSNQKFKQFKATFGEENVGLITGDVVRNENAPIVLMTTEIFRNILFDHSRPLDDIAYVIFDEIHYIADEARGFVWEESLIFLPEQVRFLGLSATIANGHELSNWMATLRSEPVKVVEYTQRPVPLSHAYYAPEVGVTDLAGLNDHYSRAFARPSSDGTWRVTFPLPDHVELVDTLGEQYLPLLFFVFSRRGCEAHANELANNHNYLSAEEADFVREAIQRHLWGRELQSLGSVAQLTEILERGIAYHHAGLLPACKELVEELFERRLIKVLYATETFAVGVNFPVRTVCFDSYTKYDGRGFRQLTVGEYFQMAGRAGRRGIDKQGFVYTMVDLNFYHPGELKERTEDKIEPLWSQFDLTYNSVLNLTARYETPGQIQDVLERNLLVYQNQARYQRLQDEIVELSREALSLKEARCPHHRQDSCIEAVKKARRQVDKLHKELANMRGIGKKGRRQQILRQLHQLGEKTQPPSIHRCGKRERESCLYRERQIRRKERRLREIKKDMRLILTPERLYEAFAAKQRFLERLGYIEAGELTGRGRIAAGLYVQELLVTELLFDGTFHELSEDAINALAVSIDYEPRKDEAVQAWRLVDLSHAQAVAMELSLMEKQLLKEERVRFHNSLHELAYRWSKGCTFVELMAGAGAMAEGDIVSAFRRGIDLLRQVRRVSTEDEQLRAKLSRCMKKMDRDVVEIRL
ncbi:MAG: DEAD/DEAH box helicase [Firmicutes bacterium]|jgi:superfamily II RNA helicase|nr:DEAD/DEAH box helicase [Bacillota bacterium]